MKGARVILAVLVCLLALSFTEAVERKSLHTLRNRLQAAASVEGRDDMTAAEQQFTPIKNQIAAEFAKLSPTSDAVEERRVYTTFAGSILTRLAPLLGPGVVLTAPDFAQLTDAQLEMASKIAYLVRHELRLKTREHMASRGKCAAFLQWLAKVRDLFVYGSVDGPTYASLVDKAMKTQGIKTLPTGVLPRSISAKILHSSTTTNEAVNKALGVSPTGAIQGQPVGNDAPLADLPNTPAVQELSKKTPPPSPRPLQEAACGRGDKVLANLYADGLKANIADLRLQFDADQLEQQQDAAPSAVPGAPAPASPKKNQQ